MNVTLLTLSGKGPDMYLGCQISEFSRVKINKHI